MKYIVGFDGGGSKTRCVLGDTQGNIIADHVGGPSNHQTIGLSKTKAVLEDLFHLVLETANISKTDIEYIFLGLAGADLPSDFEKLNEICESIFISIKFEVVNDAWIIMRSGTKDPYGAVSIYGTGANAGAINRNGEMNILRALSYNLGGGGGGGEITTDALHYAFRSNEKTYDHTLLENELPKLFNFNTIEELLDNLYPEDKIPYVEMTKVPPLVFKLAKAGDKVCQEILTTKGKLQGEMVNGILEQSKMIGSKFPVVLGGSIYKGNSPEFINAFKETILSKSPEAEFNFAGLEPVAGAYLFGLDRTNHHLTDEQLNAVQSKLALKQ